MFQTLTPSAVAAIHDRRRQRNCAGRELTVLLRKQLFPHRVGRVDRLHGLPERRDSNGGTEHLHVQR